MKLPNLCYVGDAVVGVVSECQCPGIPRNIEDLNITIHPDREHESHDIVPVRGEDDLPEGVDFEHYKQWCRMFAAAPDLLAACRALPLDCTFEDAADFKDNSEKFMRAIRLARAAVAKAEGEPN